MGRIGRNQSCGNHFPHDVAFITTLHPDALCALFAPGCATGPISSPRPPASAHWTPAAAVTARAYLAGSGHPGTVTGDRTIQVTCARRRVPCGACRAARAMRAAVPRRRILCDVLICLA